MKKPRVNSRQTGRCNVVAESVEDYYRIAFYIPFIDTYITHLRSFFTKHKLVFENCGTLFPKNDFDVDKCKGLHKFYATVLDCSENGFVSEVKMWRRRVGDQKIKNVFEALDVRIIFKYYIFIR